MAYSSGLDLTCNMTLLQLHSRAVPSQSLVNTAHVPVADMQILGGCRYKGKTRLHYSSPTYRDFEFGELQLPCCSQTLTIMATRKQSDNVVWSMDKTILYYPCTYVGMFKLQSPH